VVISTISGEAQLALADAAAIAQVRHFVPSGFSGPQQCAPQTVAASTNEWQTLISRLDHHESHSAMRYTIFTCGIFYEQFGPGGLNGMQISTVLSQNAGIGDEGAFLVDLRAGKTTIPIVPGGRQEAVICMTSARDVARYIVAAMQTYEETAMWPNEFKFCTERMTMSELLNICSRVRGPYYVHSSCPCIRWRNVSDSVVSNLSVDGATIEHADSNHDNRVGTLFPPAFVSPQALQKTITQAESSRNARLYSSTSQLLACAEGAFDISPASINLPATILALARTEEPAERFEEWLSSVWTTPSSASTSTAASASLGVTSHDTSRSSSAKSGTKSR